MKRFMLLAMVLVSCGKSGETGASRQCIAAAERAGYKNVQVIEVRDHPQENITEVAMSGDQRGWWGDLVCTTLKGEVFSLFDGDFRIPVGEK